MIVMITLARNRELTQVTFCKQGLLKAPYTLCLYEMNTMSKVICFSLKCIVLVNKNKEYFFSLIHSAKFHQTLRYSGVYTMLFSDEASQHIMFILYHIQSKLCRHSVDARPKWYSFVPYSSCTSIVKTGSQLLPKVYIDMDIQFMALTIIFFCSLGQKPLT